MTVAFVITTRNRCAELLRTLEACRHQDYPHIDIHVVDDCSSDNTFDMVRKYYPNVIITKNNHNLGSIPSRNILLNRINNEIAIGLDDDSHLIAKDAVSRVVRKFKFEPDLGVIQFQEQGPQFPSTLKKEGLKSGEWHVPSYASNRFALRMSLLKQTGLLPYFFYHMYEEPDLAIRIWNSGFRCLLWNEIVVWHEYSSKNRDERRNHYFHARNELLSNWMRTPWPYVMPLTVWRMVRQALYSVMRGWGLIELKVWTDAFRMLPTALRYRKPVRRDTLKRSLLLGKLQISSREEVWKVGKSKWFGRGQLSASS